MIILARESLIESGTWRETARQLTNFSNKL